MLTVQTAYDGSEVSVNSIVARQDDTVVVGGAFAAAGSLSCLSVCSWNPKTSQWNALGPGLNGVVSSLDLAGVSSVSWNAIKPNYFQRMTSVILLRPVTLRLTVRRLLSLAGTFNRPLGVCWAPSTRCLDQLRQSHPMTQTRTTCLWQAAL
jgi:hypothetical protein